MPIILKQLAGFDIIDGDSAIVPVMLYDAKSVSQTMADNYLKKNLRKQFFLSSCSKDKARIRVQYLLHIQNSFR
jgi:glycine C-acetyltransferase